MIPASSNGLVLVTGGSGYIAGYCIAQLLQDGWRVRTTVRSLAKAEQVRSSITKISAGAAAAIEFFEADLNSDQGGTALSPGRTMSCMLPRPSP